MKLLLISPIIVMTCMKLAKDPLISTSQISAMYPGASMLNAPENPVRNLPRYSISTLTANTRKIQPVNIGRERSTMVHFLPYLGMTIPVIGPAVNAPKLRRAATQLCCSMVSIKRPSHDSGQL